MRLASKPTTTASRDALHTAIRDRVPFTSSGALTAVTADGTGELGFLGGGQLADQYRHLYRRERPTYVVYSYATPIAWWSERDDWTIPDVKYTVTTSKHQHHVRMAVNA
jgi:hypothetical protein